ncbi:MAG: hypothetical protein ACXVJV_18715, partial [Mucilaginibacter sp.]
MGRSIAVVYTPDDNLEHAYQLLYPSLGLNSGFPVRDVSFSPQTQGKVATAMPYTPQNTIWAIAAAYSPVDGMRYIFYATSDNKVFWTRNTKYYWNPPHDPLVNGRMLLVGDFPAYPANAIQDMAAYFTGSEIEVVVLLNNGDLWRMGGAPWTGSLAWSQIPFFAKFTGAKRIAVFEGAGWGHIMVATDHSITEVYYVWNGFGQTTIWTFADPITDVGCFYDSGGTAHVIASIKSSQGTDVFDIRFVPAQVPPALFKLGTVPFVIDSLGAYQKPDGGMHV